MLMFNSGRRARRSAVALAIGFLLSSAAQAQFGGFLQSVIGAAAQQATQQAIQPAPAVVNPYAAQAAGATALSAAQTNAIASAAVAIPVTDPEYQGLMAQSLASVPADQRSTLAPILDMQVRQAIASRRLGLAGTPQAVAPQQLTQGVAANPLAQQAVQGALMQGLAGRNAGYGYGGLPANLGGDAGKAAAAGALIQGLGSFFSRPASPPVAVAEPVGAAGTQPPLATAP